MENCLKTTLKGEVQNNQLPILGQVKIVFQAPSDNYTTPYSINASEYSNFIFTDTTKMTLSGNAYFVRNEQNLGKNVTLGAGPLAANSVKIHCDDKNDVVLTIDNIYNVSTHIGENRDCVGFPGNATSVFGWESCKFIQNMTSIAVQSPTLVIKLKDILKNYQPANIKTVFLENTSKIIGDIKELGSLFNAYKVHCNASKGLYGNVEDFVEELVNNGLADGASIAVRMNANTSILFHDSPSLAGAGQFITERNGNIVTIVQGGTTKGTYNITTQTWTYA